MQENEQPLTEGSDVKKHTIKAVINQGDWRRGRQSSLTTATAPDGRLKLYVAECLEINVVTQGRTLDETVANVREAVSLFLDGEDLNELGLAPTPALAVIMPERDPSLL